MSQHISACEHCGHIHCGEEQCMHHASGACLLDNPAVGLDLDEELYCWDYETEDYISSDDPSMDYLT